MGELLSKVGGFIVKGTKSIATGKSQGDIGLQSPQLASSMVRVGRFLYVSSLGWIVVCWYTGYVNERTKEKEVRFVLPGSVTAVIAPPDRPNKPLPGLGSSSGGGLGSGGLPGVPGEIGEDIGKILGDISYQQPEARAKTKGRKLIPISPSQMGVPGTAIAGYLFSAPDDEKQKPPYSAATYRSLIPIASAIGNQFHLKITSGYRPGSTGSLHASGLAFDMVGRETDMKRAAAWAAKYPGIFQEIFVHDEGSGLHIHLGFYPDAAEIYNSMGRYNSARVGQSSAPAASPLTQGA